jgi:hypothetical protein
MAVFYLAATGVLGLAGWSLQRTVYDPPPPPGQMYAAVFVRDPAAQVTLSADIDPDQPWQDSLTVTVGRVPPAQAGWLLVVECPGATSRSPAVPLYSEAVPQAQSAATLAAVVPGVASPRGSIMLGCYTKPSSLLSTTGYSPSLSNVSLAALQLDGGMVDAQGLPVLYAQQSRPGETVRRLVQIFPDVSCPPSTPTPTPTQSSSAAMTRSSPAVATPQPSATSTAPAPSTSPTLSTSPATSSSPSPSLPSATTAANPGCLNLAPTNAKLIKYQIPEAESTIETLNSVNYRDYQLSMYPTGDSAAENNGDESIIWKSASAQDPSFEATDAAAQLNGQRDIFMSGILWGITGGVAVAGVDQLYQAYQERKRKQNIIP